MSFVRKNPSAGESPQSTIIRIQEKLMQIAPIQFRENITFICAEENMHF
jgi:hypothetical protein